MAPSRFLVAVVVAVAVLPAALGGGVFFDDFTNCTGTPNPLVWRVPQMQWGGDNINGGVSPQNVKCVYDSKLNKNVLQFSASGDQFTGTGPTGVMKNGDARGATDEFSGWDWGLYKTTCSPYCNVRRVGGAVTSYESFTGGVLEFSMKPCPQFGVTSAVWLFNYTEHYCNAATETCSPEYTAQCCTTNPCTAASDVCQGAWYANQEIDFELPTADAPQRATDPDWIAFFNARFSSYTAVASSSTAKCGVAKTCAEEDYAWVGSSLNDGNYHSFQLNWFPSNSTVEYYVDGVQRAAISGAAKVPTLGNLWMAAWIPNAWAGSPDFDTCTMSIDYIRFTPVD